MNNRIINKNLKITANNIGRAINYQYYPKLLDFQISKKKCQRHTKSKIRFLKDQPFRIKTWKKQRGLTHVLLSKKLSEDYQHMYKHLHLVL